MIRPEDIRRPPALQPAPGAERLHALDACRAVAMLLGLYLHAALPHRPQAEGTWAFTDAARSAWMAVSVEVIHAFRMQVFFLLAGFFAALLIERRGWRGLLRNRGVRIGVPYLFGIIVLAPVCTAAWIWAEGEWAYVTPGPLVAAVGQSWHLWFLRELLIFCVVAAAVAAIFPRDVVRKIAAPVGRVAVHPLGPLAVAAVVMVTLLAQPWWGIHGPEALPRWENLVHYGLFFGIGAAMWPVRAGITAVGRWWPVWAVVGAVAAAAHFAVLGWFTAEAGAEYAWIGAEPVGAAFAARGAYAVMAAALVYAFLGVFVRIFGRASAFWRYISDASYWVYLMHFPLIVVLGAAIAPWPWPAEVKVLTVLVAATAALFGSYALFVRRTAVGRLLNGPSAAGRPSVVRGAGEGRSGQA